MSFDDRHISPWAFGAVDWAAGAGEAGGGLVCASAGTSIADASRPPSRSVRIWSSPLYCELSVAKRRQLNFGSLQARSLCASNKKSGREWHVRFGSKARMAGATRNVRFLPIEISTE